MSTETGTAGRPAPDEEAPGPLTHAGADEPAAGPLPLLVWLSPAFPAGSFAFSHGLEWAAEARD
ncbi:MAG TPA: hypothetical protein VE665_08350, partial [Hyphomicrobiaceae bacterium]|nr:hypothetical protein [Hyphomicrobiaceae bacterium]